jgi:heat shock protein HspQ
MIMFRRPDREVDGPTQFLPGDLVQHRRYGYRGVVVDVDLTCQASSEWYNSNQTQPDQKKPWYHVLVDGSTHSTYAAEDNLEPASSSEPVHHPLLGVFFESFVGGSYKRNYRPWSL